MHRGGAERRALDGRPATMTDAGVGLDSLGLRVGEPVRFRRRQNSRWQDGRVIGRERDGSVGVRDGRGAARALPATAVEVRRAGPRGGMTWETVSELAARAEQLRLL
jgi:hypothetical protein